MDNKYFKAFYIATCIIFLVSAVKDTTDLRKQIAALQQNVSSVSTAITQFEQQSQANISKCKTQYDKSKTKINNQKAILKNFTCIVCESKIKGFSDYDYNATINESISNDRKKYEEVLAPIIVQLKGYQKKLSNITSELDKCGTDPDCIKTISDQLNSTGVEVLVSLKKMNKTLQAANANLSQTIEKAVNETIQEIQIKANDVIDCFSELVNSKQKIDSLEIVATLVSNASQKIMQTNTSTYDFSSKASGEFSKYIEEETKRAAKEADDHKKEAENKNDNIESCVKVIPELEKIKESSLKTFYEGMSEYGKTWSNLVNESLWQFKQDLPDLKALLSALQGCSNMSCIENAGQKADSQLKGTKENIDQTLNAAVEKSEQIKTDITSMKTNVENRFKKELNGTVSSILDCLDYRTADKKVLLEKLAILSSLLESTTNALNRTENKTRDDLNNYINDNRIIYNCIRMNWVINETEAELGNFSHKACVDLANIYKKDYSAFLEKVNNYSHTYENLFDNRRKQIGLNVTQIKEIEDNLNHCKLKSCLTKANASMNVFNSLKSELNSFLDATEKQNAYLRNNSYASLNNSAAEISPHGKKAETCLNKLSDTKRILIKNDERLNKTFKLAKKHLAEQTTDIERFMNITCDNIDHNLTAEINSTENRIEIHKKKAVYFNVNITSCGEEKPQLYGAKDKFLNLFEDSVIDLTKYLLDYLNQTLKYIGKYKTANMLTNLSLCPDEVCIDSLLNISNDAPKDIVTQLKMYDEEIKRFEGGIAIKKRAIEENYSVTANKIYKDMTECIDNLWISKSRLSEDIKNVSAGFVKVIEDLHQIELSADRELDDYQKNNISAVHSAYKQNISKIESAEATLKNFEYKVCKNSLSVFKVENYSKLLDEIFSDYKNAYEKFIEESDNSSRDAVTRLQEVKTNLTKCQDTDNECLSNVFTQYESYLGKDLKNITRNVSERIKTLSYYVLQNVTQIIERLSIEGDQAVGCIQKLAGVKVILDKTQTSLISVQNNLTSQLGEAIILAENKTKNFREQTQEILANLTRQIKDEEAIAAKKKINVSPCYSDKTPENKRHEYIELFSREVEKRKSDLNRTGISCSEKIKEYTANISTAYKELSECTQESCMGPILETAQKIKNEQITDVEFTLSSKIDKFSSIIRAKSVIIIHNFANDVTPLTNDILECIKSRIANSSTLPQISFILIWILVIVQLNFNVS